MNKVIEYVDKMQTYLGHINNALTLPPASQDITPIPVYSLTDVLNRDLEIIHYGTYMIINCPVLIIQAEMRDGTPIVFVSGDQRFNYALRRLRLPRPGRILAHGDSYVFAEVPDGKPAIRRRR